MIETEESIPRYPIRIVVGRTGLQPYLIRAWEQRYGALQLGQQEGGERLYSDLDIVRLNLLRRATELGHEIAELARLGDQALRDMLQNKKSSRTVEAPYRSPKVDQGVPIDSDLALRFCLDAVRRLDGAAITKILEQTVLKLGLATILIEVVPPLLQEVCRLRRTGRLRPVHERLTNSALRFFLGTLISRAKAARGAPAIVVATPLGQHLEIGALLAGAIAAGEGWRVTYLGPELEAEEIALACRQQQAVALAINLTYAQDPDHLAEELQRLRRLIGSAVGILVGGQEAGAHQQQIGQIDARWIQDLRQIPVALGEIWQRPCPPSGKGSVLLDRATVLERSTTYTGRAAG